MLVVLASFEGPVSDQFLIGDFPHSFLELIEELLQIVSAQRL